MLEYSDCQKLIEENLIQLYYDEEPNQLYSPIRYILRLGGKRLRPCFTLLAHNLFSENIKDALYPALGIEVFHNFTLLHDDIMDNASMRRKQETVHKKWNENTAILSGDAMMIIAYDLISKSRSEIFPDVFKIFNKTALEVCEGQQYDMNFEKQNSVKVNEYLKMIRLKTAVLFGASLAIGGITALSGSENIENLYQLGINVGSGFQLQDDYLDVFASSADFGKKIGGDIIANKKTYLLIMALNSNNKNAVKELKGWIEKKGFDPEEKVQAVKRIYQNLGIDEATRILASEYIEKGLIYLSQISADKERKNALQNLILQITKREN
ncbi:MAG: polyprenyl synthetase family protein [Bacteroidales bacterium]|nr:polyprenyl synthetase family protein [Bacteroidales bacterium]